MVVDLCGDAAIVAVVVLFVFSSYPIVPSDIGDIVLVGGSVSVVGIAAITSAEIGAELAVSGVGDDGFSFVHVAEFRSTAKDAHAAIADGGTDVALCSVGKVKPTAVELIDVGIIDLPGDVAVGVVGGMANSFTSCSRHHSETSTVDVALGIVIVVISISAI